LTVFSETKSCVNGDEQAAGETEDEDVALDDGVAKKYIPACPRLRSRLKALETNTP
jgi:hypothetical protein